MPVRRQLIEKITVGSNTASVTFSNIPQNFKDLKIVISARMSDTAAIQTVRLRYNDISANYQSRFLYYGGTAGSALSGVTTYGAVGDVNATGSLSNTFGSVEINIPNYTSSVNKTTHTYAAAPNNASASWIGNSVIGFPSTSPITKIQIYADTIYQFLANSTFYLYGITHVPIIRGGEVEVRDGFKYHTFKSTASLQVVEPGEVECLVVAGGGGGGYIGAIGGGGGAGGYRSYKLSLSPQIHSIIIGSGGTGSTSSSNPTNGSNSSFNVLSTTGGGAGGSISFTATSGGSGGGGGESRTSGASGNSGSYTPVEGYAGGNGAVDAGGGGGGASEAGTNGTRNVTAGNGGNGRQWPDSSGAYYSGGGGGSLGSSTTIAGRQGGLGGGGNGGSRNLYVSATSGLQNTGGGGGGEPNFTPLLSGGNGGSGIVIIRYPYDGN